MIETIPVLVILLFSVICHEYAHARVALWKGDTTARDLGRITLNPLPHIDPFGTVLLPLMLFLIHSPFLIGAAKPVPVNPSRFQNPKKDMLLVSMAGPANNMILAICAGIIARIAVGLGLSDAIYYFLNWAVTINLVLAFFNLIPVPPLDGSEIIMYHLPDHLAEKYARIGRFGMIIIILLFILGPFRGLIGLFVYFFRGLILG